MHMSYLIKSSRYKLNVIDWIPAYAGMTKGVMEKHKWQWDD